MGAAQPNGRRLPAPKIRMSITAKTRRFRPQTNPISKNFLSFPVERTVGPEGKGIYFVELYCTLYRMDALSLPLRPRRRYNRFFDCFAPSPFPTTSRPF